MHQHEHNQQQQQEQQNLLLQQQQQEQELQRQQYLHFQQQQLQLQLQMQMQQAQVQLQLAQAQAQEAQAQASHPPACPTPSFSFDYDYRGAIALNNIGVTLLERGCYRYALDALQDSISVMKELFRPTPAAASAAATAVSRPHCTEIDTYLKRATRRLAQHQAGSSSSSPQAQQLPSYLAKVETIYFDVCMTPVLDYLGETPSTTTFLPIRIDLPPSPDSCYATGGDGMNYRDPDIESSIILYNFGIANFLISKTAAMSATSTTSAAATGEKLRSNALSILQLASGVLSKRSAVCDDSLEEANLLQLGLLVFHAIIQVLIEMGDDYEAAIVCDRYDRIRDAVVSLHQTEWYGTGVGKTVVGPNGQINTTRVTAPAA